MGSGEKAEVMAGKEAGGQEGRDQEEMDKEVVLRAFASDRG